MTISILGLFALFLLAPFLWLGLGDRVLHVVPESFRMRNTVRDSVRILLGLLISLWLSFGLKLIGAPWALASLLPLLLGARSISFYRERLRALVAHSDLNFALWWCVHLGIAVTVVRTVGPIETSWTNNYGDIAFHLGIITSFAFGDNFPPEYPIFPGAKLSYPFFVNFWSALLWWPSGSFRTLSLVFVYQWMAVWTLLYFLLQGAKHKLLPWAILLGGGCWFTLGENSGLRIEKGAPWATFISTIWVPQRTAMFGLAPLVAIGVLYLESLAYSLKERRAHLALAGFILGLSLLVHTHFMLAAALLIGVALLLDSFWGAGDSESFEFVARSFLAQLFSFAAPMLIGIIAFPWLLGKSGVVEWRSGWMPLDWSVFWAHAGSFRDALGAAYEVPRDARGGVVDGVLLWLFNAPIWFVLLGVGWWSLRRHAWFAAIVLVFVVGNIVHFAPWEWDQLKFFIALYVLSLLSLREVAGYSRLLVGTLVIGLCIPSMYELWSIGRTRPLFGVYSAEDVRDSEIVRKFTPPRGKFAAAPNHNSMITLTGRRLWCGYDGTLWSHGIPYQDRRSVLERLSKISECLSTDQAVAPGGCPEYLLWREPERAFWKTQVPPGEYIPMDGTSILYKFGATD